MKIYKNKKGFTLLEIILTITAIGMLSSIVLVALNPNRQLESARSVKRKADMDIIAKAVEQYVVNNRGKYPPSLQSVVIGGTVGLCVTSPCVGGIDLTNDLAPYIATIPLPDIGQYTITKTATGITPGYDSSLIWKTAGNTAPTLDLNFARDKQLVNAVNGSNPITFTRASTSTYTGSDGLIKTAAVNEPRFTHDPITKSSQGLLIEDARTNLWLYSTDISNVYWEKSGSMSATANQSLAPDGTNTGTLMSASGTYPNVAKTIAVSAGQIYTYSVFVKYINQQNANIVQEGWGSNYSMNINLVAGTITAGSNITASSITPYGNNWYRVSATYTVPAGQTTFRPQFRIGNYDGINYNGSQVYLWGAQVELGAFPTSYIPTTGVTVTRAADVASITGANFSNWYNNANSTFYASGIATNTSNGRILTFNDSATGVVFLNGNAGVSTRSLLAPATTSSIYGWGPFTAIPLNSTYKGAATITPGMNGTYSLNGQNTATSSSLPNVPTYSGVDMLQIGPSAGGGSKGNIISRIIYWNNRLSNTILADITK